MHRLNRAVSATHDPPEDFQFNKLRQTGGSYRLTLVKPAVDRANIDPRPPRPELVHLPASPCAWLGIDLEAHPSQSDRVAAREAVTDKLAPGTPMAGECPVSLKGKLGSAVTRVPQDVVDRLDLETGNRVTTITITDGALLFVTERVIEDSPETVLEAVAAARATLE